MLKVKLKKKLDNICLDVNFETNDDILGLIGASGSGKSMTLKCIAGIENPDEGYIILNDRVLFDSSKGINLRTQERRIGYLFQYSFFRFLFSFFLFFEYAQYIIDLSYDFLFVKLIPIPFFFSHFFV